MPEAAVAGAGAQGNMPGQALSPVPALPVVQDFVGSQS